MDDLRKSPFLELQTPFTKWELFKMIVLLPTVIPRLLIGFVVLSIIAIINTLATLGCNIDEPLPKWRRSMLLFSKELLAVVFVMLGYRVRVLGRENLRLAAEQQAVTIFNHVSWVDAFALVWIFAPAGVSIARNAKIPIISQAVRALQTIYIQPDKKKDAEGVTSILLRRVQHPKYGRAGGYPLLVLAPEGTCGNGRCLLQFRTGAFVLKRPVLPILFNYGMRCHNPAWTIINEPWHFLRLLCQFRNTLDVTFLPVYHPSPEELADPSLYASNVRALMAKELGVPLIEQGHNEYKELLKRGVGVSWDGKRVTGL